MDTFDASDLFNDRDEDDQYKVSAALAAVLCILEKIQK